MSPYDFKHPNFMAAMKKHEHHEAKLKELAVNFEDLPNFLKPVVDFTTKSVLIDNCLKFLPKDGIVNWFEENRESEQNTKLAYEWVPKILKINEK